MRKRRRRAAARDAGRRNGAASGHKPARAYAWNKGRKLAPFVAKAHGLTRRQRKTIVQQALVLFSDNYVHLPAKRARYSVDPVQRLKLMLQTLERKPAADTTWPMAEQNETAFHREVTSTFTSVRDLHTQYLLPDPFSRATAFLPFLVEAYWVGSGKHRKRKYIVSHVEREFRKGSFGPGVQVTHWNGTPIDRAVSNNGEFFGGGNPDARHALGLQGLTVRPLKMAPPPEEEWVIVRYREVGGARRELTFDWRVAHSSSDHGAADASADGADRGLDLQQHLTRIMHRKLFRPPEKERASMLPRNRDADLWTSLKDNFAACRVRTDSGVFGYFRIWSFQPQEGHTKEEFIAEFVRLLEKLPPRGLIIDVRSNGGGSINCAERILQTLTPRTIEPESFQFINTPLNLKICRRSSVRNVSGKLTPWTSSMEQSLQTGAIYSAGLPIASAKDCNGIGQKYFGPVVLITDALSYSSTDIFAAGFADHSIGTVFGVDASTGAGGANVWYHSDMLTALARKDPENVYRALPKKADMRVSIRRALRVGPSAGTLLEDVGVAPDVRYFMTRKDLLERNSDLIEEAGRELARHRPRAFKLTRLGSTHGETRLRVQTSGMSRLDVYLSDRPLPQAGLDRHGSTILRVPDLASPDDFVEIRGYRRRELVARVRWPGPL